MVANIKETDIKASELAIPASDPRLRQRGHWDRRRIKYNYNLAPFVETLAARGAAVSLTTMPGSTSQMVPYHHSMLTTTRYSRSFAIVGEYLTDVPERTWVRGKQTMQDALSVDMSSSCCLHSVNWPARLPTTNLHKTPLSNITDGRRKFHLSFPSCANMGKVKRFELWWQLYHTSLSVWDLENFRPMDFCWHECTTGKIVAVYINCYVEIPYTDIFKVIMYFNIYCVSINIFMTILVTEDISCLT